MNRNLYISLNEFVTSSYARLYKFNFKVQHSLNSPKFRKSNCKPSAVCGVGRAGERDESFLVVILTQQENPKLGNRPSVDSTVPQPVLSLCYPFLFARPAPVSHSPPIRSHETDKWWSLTLARTKDSFEPRGESPFTADPWARRSISRSGTFDLPPEAALLLFPRLGEINSWCLRVFATGRISPFMDCSIPYFCSLGFIRKFYGDKSPKIKRGKRNYNVEPVILH